MHASKVEQVEGRNRLAGSHGSACDKSSKTRNCTHFLHSGLRQCLTHLRYVLRQDPKRYGAGVEGNSVNQTLLMDWRTKTSGTSKARRWEEGRYRDGQAGAIDGQGVVDGVPRL